MKNWLPKRLAGQLILLLLTTLVVSQTVTLLLSLSQTDGMLERVQNNTILKMSARAANTLDQASEVSQSRLLKLISSYRTYYYVDDKPSVAKSLINEKDQVKIHLLEQLLHRKYEQVYIHQYPTPESRILVVVKYFFNYLFSFDGTVQDKKKEDAKRKVLFSTSIQLDDKRWLNMVLYDRQLFPSYARLALNSLLSVSLIASLIVTFSIKRLTRPLKELASRARELGVGEEVKAVSERGPEDLKETIEAFNSMQYRLQNLITHRTRSLAAMSHDLRTPLTSLRLEAEFISDDEVHSRIVKKLDEMEHITQATLSFAKQDSWSEKRREVDLTALIDCLCQDLMDIGLAIECEISGQIFYPCRPVALNRAFSNLIENGVKYGESVSVHLTEGKDVIEVVISDHGPGIPETQQQRLFEPFERLDESRNQVSGGVGLGLTIALTIIRGHGGDIRFKNRSDSGLDVIVELPKH